MPNSKRRDKSKPNSKYARAGDFLGVLGRPAGTAGKRRNELASPAALPVWSDHGMLGGRERGRHCGCGAGEPMNFASDNAAGLAPEILAAIAAANEGAALAY